MSAPDISRDHIEYIADMLGNEELPSSKAAVLALLDAKEAAERQRDEAMAKLAHRDEQALSIRGSFADSEYRHAYAAAALDTRMSMQIRIVRGQRGMTQAQLADAAGMKQSRISQMEDVSYGAWTASTLKRIAEALDVPMTMSFGRWNDIAVAIGTEGFKRDTYEQEVARLASVNPQPQEPVK